MIWHRMNICVGKIYAECSSNTNLLSEQLKKMYPDLKVLLISGYPAEAFADRGGGGPGEALLHKPFAPKELAAKVREILTESPNSQ